MCGTTIAILIVLIIVVSALIVNDTKDNFSSPVNFGLAGVYQKIRNNWDFYPLWTVEKGTVIVCTLFAMPTSNTRIRQDRVVVIENDIQDFDLLDYLRKTASTNFNIESPGVYTMIATVVYIPSKQNPDLAYYPVFYLQENYNGVPIPGNTFVNPNDSTQFEVPEFIKSCRLNRHARIVVTKLPSKTALTLVADSPKL